MATTVKIDAALKARIQELASARQRSSHWLMCEAIREYVDREEKRETFKQDALQAWESYQANGKRVSSSDADAWLVKLENGEDAELPE